MGRTPAGQTRQRILEFMRERLLAGTPPTVREVQQAFGFRAVQSAREHLEALVAEGLLSKESGRARGYRLPPSFDHATETMLVPLLGRVQAGQFTTALEEPQGFLPLPAAGRGENTLFALRVRGESMKDAAILEDDIVIVRRQAEAATGDIVVALVDDEATVKTFRRRGRAIELVPANPDFEVIRPRPDSGLQILGKVVEVRRYLETLPLVAPVGPSGHA